jgi:Family of unknown function (DUF6510)
MHLDGNAAAGPLSDIFAREVTAALVTCASCGSSGPLGAAMLYGEAMGQIVRCATCDAVLLCCADTPAGVRLDMRGVSVIAWP